MVQPSRLVDWLRVLTPMRAIRVRAWVEVVGSEIISFQSSMKCEKFISGATLREKQQACCQRANSKVLGPAVYKILQSSTKSRIRPRTSGGKNSVRKTGERYQHCEEKSGSVALKPVKIPPLYRI